MTAQTITRQVNTPDALSLLPATWLLHLQKCAGTSWMDLMRREFGEQNVFWQIWINEDSDALHVGSHAPYNVAWMRIQDEDRETIIFLRDPIQRTVSIYHHIKFNNDHILHNDVQGMSLSDFLKEHEWFSTHDNYMTRFLASGDPHLDTALTRLHTITHVGFVETFVEDIARIFKTWRLLPPLQVPRSRVATPAGYQVNDYDVQLLVERNEIDLALYRYAQQVFRKGRF